MECIRYIMKKINKKKQHKILALYKYRNRKTLRRKRTKSFIYDNQGKINYKKQRIVIEAPKVFAIQTQSIHRNKTIKFIDKIKEILNGNGRVHINFNQTTHLLSCGTIWFLSEIRQLIDNPNYQGKINWSTPKDDTVHQLLKHVGFFSWFNKKSTAIINKKIVTQWGFIQGNKLDDLKQLDTTLMEKIENRLLFSAIQEAVINTIQHAYEGYSMPLVNNKWSIFYTYDNTDQTLSLAICDLGIGIYKSFIGQEETNTFFQNMTAFIGQNEHSKAIEAAVQYSASRTNEINRGKGFEDMKRVVQQSQNGGLRILSYKGGYRLSSRQNKQTEKLINFHKSSKCTIIMWHFGLAAAEEVYK